MTERTANEIAHARAVKEMFGGIAARYDFLNHFLSLSIDKRWRRAVARQLEGVLDKESAVVLDVACGTGDLAFEMHRNAKAQIIGTDFCRPMIAVAAGKNKAGRTAIPFVEGDAMNLSFADESFDAVTIAFGLRNLSHFRDGLIELRRVLKSGGRLVVLEFSTPRIPGFRQGFNFYFNRILPRIGGAVSNSRSAYEYLPNSVSKFPDQKRLAELMKEIGFGDVRYQNLTGGIAAIHQAVK